MDETPQSKARDALFEAITARVGDSVGAIDDVATLADAYAKVAYGLQGANTDYRYSADYHHTEHGGQPRTPPAGFGST